ncbi:MAG: DUF459 domain-containing protein [Shinella sp.]|nr:DUF459 domain-containing protein [Shinella sp.]
MLVVVTLAALVVPQTFDYAQAQERVERRSILQMLFGSRPRREVREEPVRRPPQRRTTRKKKSAPRAIVAKPAPVVVQKLPDAKTVLVVGDFLADGIGEGLVTAFETTPGIVVKVRANGSSGLVRDDYYDWPETLPSIIAEEKPAVLVLSVGANDRQQMAINGAKEKFRTEAWIREYQNRVAEMASIATKGSVPLLWVGVPPFQSSSMTADMIALNDLYRSGAEKAGGGFVDIWDGFVDEGGKFVLTGSDINGQQVRLRGSDGITFTKAGKRKLAFYVEKEIRRLLGDAAASGNLQGTGELKDIQVKAPLANEEIVKTQPISLADPELDGGSALLGSEARAKGNGKSPRDRLVEKGEVAAAPAGRVDDFRMDKSAPSAEEPQSAAAN